MTSLTSGTTPHTGRKSGTRRASRLAAAAAILIAIGLASCSDDIVCPGDTVVIAPSITASVIESRLASGERTLVSVHCVADPLPDQFVVFVTGREITDVELDFPLALVATLDDTAVVWQHGQGCSLRVNTDAGLSTATEIVPGPFSVQAPEDISLGDALTFAWEPSDSADYYTVRCVIRGARNDSLVLMRSATDTTVSFDPDDITMTGIASGWVRATTGPFPDGGSDGNITGEGWGFFTVSYYDSLCLFEFSVNDPAGK